MGVSEENGVILNPVPVLFSLMKQRLVFLHLLDHTTTNSRKSWVEVFPFTGIRTHKTQIQQRRQKRAESSFFVVLPCAERRSKEVTRFSEETVLPMQPQDDDTFWKTVGPLSGEDLFTNEPFLPSTLYSSSPVGMVSRHKRVSTSLTHEMLPHPSQLMCRMRRCHRLQKHTPTVLQHLGELRMKQRHINELKGDKWWGATAVGRPEDSSGSQKLAEGGDEQLLGPAAGVSISAMLMDNPDVTMTMPYEAAPSPTLLFSFTEYEKLHDLAPGGNPMMAFISGTAHRSLLMADDACAAVNSGTSDGILMSNDDEISLFY